MSRSRPPQQPLTRSKVPSRTWLPLLLRCFARFPSPAAGSCRSPTTSRRCHQRTAIRAGTVGKCRASQRHRGSGEVGNKGPAAAPPKVTSHCPFSRPRAPKSHKPRPFLPARAPKSHKSRPFLASQKSRLNSRPSPPKVTSHGPFSRPTAPFSRQVTALSPGMTPGPAPQESRLNSRPPAPQESQVTALSPGPAPQKSQVTALSPPTSVLAASRHERPAAHESTFFRARKRLFGKFWGRRSC